MSCGRIDGQLVNDLATAAVIEPVAIPSGLGGTSAHTWMKLPVVPDTERVMAATTLPTLLLGGDVIDEPDRTFATWEGKLEIPGVRGLAVGRTVLYPSDRDVAADVDLVASLVHSRLTTDGGEAVPGPAMAPPAEAVSR